MLVSRSTFDERDLEELKSAGFTHGQAEGILAARALPRTRGISFGGMSAAERGAELRSAGFTPAQLLEAGFAANVIREAGFTPEELMEGMGTDISMLREVRAGVAAGARARLGATMLRSVTASAQSSRAARARAACVAGHVLRYYRCVARRCALRSLSTSASACAVRRLASLLSSCSRPATPSTS